ncbi:DinG family ATP-dependent helicase CPE1197 [Lachnospiraceae bacterium KM106-2]|nr:DinG family ATP-dependent helicase CPE1197 [Lachnospiraceae bacterium KM106-2]
MSEQKTKQVKISVRNLVEFILRSGDINTSGRGVRDPEAMQLGSKLHRKIQKRMGTNYDAEVAMSLSTMIPYDDTELELIVEGRADGVLHNSEEEQTKTTIDEIKGIYMDLEYLKEPIGVHKAQVMCYAYIYALQHEEDWISIRLSYINMETELMKYFNETFSLVELKHWFEHLVHQYAKWAIWEMKWAEQRNQSIAEVNFPFEYRKGQKKLVSGVYQSIKREKKLFIEAPTGVGKTISTVFPTVKAMGEGCVKKIFYLTAKTITRTVASNTFRLLQDKGMHLKVITITAKEKICCQEKVMCNPDVCERAKGHFDRVNDAIFDLLTNENEISRELVEEYATKHMVCPFEMGLDVTMWCDCVICDYNYVFDPNVYLKRFFMQDKKMDYVFLIDEAHNLVDRAREMYSARLVKEDFLTVKKILKNQSGKLLSRLDSCNSELLKMKKEQEEFQVIGDIAGLVMRLMRLVSEFDEFLQTAEDFEDKDTVMNLYFDVHHFLNMFENMDELYEIYTDYTPEKEFRVTLQCMDPANNLKACLARGRSAIFFSATLLPIQYYKEQLSGDKDDYEIYVESSFDPAKRLIAIASDVSTKYTRRNETEYAKIIEYIYEVCSSKVGNYLVFFPSYSYMQTIYDTIALYRNLEFSKMEIILQSNQMTEWEKEAFLEAFEENPSQSKIGFCVMGGIFSEGIDLKEDRLIGTIIVGPGIPMVCNERELFREYYQKKMHRGFDYAYLYNGMNKVLQSAGRVIRTEKDEGVILLLDDRFLQKSYQNLFPREWFPHEVVQRENIEKCLHDFWNKKE